MVPDWKRLDRLNKAQQAKDKDILCNPKTPLPEKVKTTLVRIQLQRATYERKHRDN